MSPLRRDVNLAPDDVQASQRCRLLQAATEIAAEKGYAATTVADILKRARVSRLTFYEQFDNKEDCIHAAYRQVAEQVTAPMITAATAEGDFIVRFDRAVGAYLEALAADLSTARFFLVEASATGQALRESRIATQQFVAQMIATGFEATSEGQRVACEGLVGAIVALVTSRVLTGDSSRVLALQPHITSLARAIGEAIPTL